MVDTVLYETLFCSNGSSFFQTDAAVGEILDQLRRELVLRVYANNELPLSFQDSASYAVKCPEKITCAERSNVMDVLAKDVNGSWRFKNDRHGKLKITDAKTVLPFVRRYYTNTQSEAKRVIAYFVVGEGEKIFMSTIY